MLKEWLAVLLSYPDSFRLNKTAAGCSAIFLGLGIDAALRIRSCNLEATFGPACIRLFHISKFTVASCRLLLPITQDQPYGKVVNHSSDEILNDEMTIFNIFN